MSPSQEQWRWVFCGAFTPLIELGLRRDRRRHGERQSCRADVWEGGMLTTAGQLAAALPAAPLPAPILPPYPFSACVSHPGPTHIR